MRTHLQCLQAEVKNLYQCWVELSENNAASKESIVSAMEAYYEAQEELTDLYEEMKKRGEEIVVKD